MSVQQIKEDLKIEYPTVQRGSDETGYEQITGKDYDDLINQWAKAIYAKELQAKAEAEKVSAKEALLARLGITADEAKLLLA
jgi:hypothetical protein